MGYTDISNKYSLREHCYQTAGVAGVVWWFRLWSGDVESKVWRPVFVFRAGSKVSGLSVQVLSVGTLNHKP